MRDRLIERAILQRGTIPSGMAKTVKLKPPSIATMTRWMNDGVAKAVDGCKVEPDGTCQHGSPSWLLKLGYI